MAKRRKIAPSNTSSTGWWIFSEIQQWVSKRQKKLTPKSRCLVWENLRLVQAKDRDEAYRKAMEHGRAGHPSPTVDGEWRFAGITMLLPIYEPFADGAEVLWTDWEQVTVKRIQEVVKSKRELPVFDDSEPA